MRLPFPYSLKARSLSLFNQSQKISIRTVRPVGRVLCWTARPPNVISLFLMLSLILNSTPAAASTVVSVAKESALDFSFWFHSSALVNFFQGQRRGIAQAQERQADRDAKVTRLQIYPGDLTINVGDHAQLAAVAYDDENNPVGGVKTKWRAESASPGRRIRVTPSGELTAVAPGSFTIIAEAAQRSAQINVVVSPGTVRDPKAPPTGTREISTRDLPNAEAGAAKQPEKTTEAPRAVAKVEDRNKRTTTSAKKAHAAPKAAPFFISNGWDDTNYWSADDPGNGVGTTPGNPVDGGAGSGNFQLVAPVIGTAGRGINISLALSYNSRVWNKAGSNINYDNDHGWPAPGFNLGFGKLLGITINSGCMIVEADGTRHPYSGSITFYSWGTVGVMHTTDGSFIDYTYQTGTNGVMTYAQAKLQNGTVINYGAYSQSGGGMFPTSISDANGNYIIITYVNNSGPRIQTITDTLGRVINFYYNTSNLLTAITAAGLSGGTRTLARLHYHQHSLSYGFSGLTASARDYYPWVIDAIYYPATGTGYWFNDSDSYSSYGMLAKVVEERSMGFSSSGLTDMGTVSQGSITRSETYNYPLTPNYSLTDAPTYTQFVESWSRDGTNFDSATTSYSVNENSSPRSIVITLPNGTKTKQLSYNAPGVWNDGLVYHDETYVTDGQPLQSSDVTWASGAYSAPRPTRIEKRNELNQVLATEFSYGSVYNQITDMRDYDYGGTALIRSTRTTYENSTNYTGSCNSYGCYGRHIFNLPLSVEIYASDNVTRVSRTEYQYDGQTLSAAPGVVMHDQASNPHADEEGYCYWDYDWNDPDCTGGCWDYNCDGYCPQYYVCPYDYSTDYRGLVTQTTTYANAAALTGPVTQTKRYDVTGNVVQTTATSFEQTSYAYSVNNQYAQPLSKTQGSPTDPYAQITSSATYDFYTDLVLSTTDADGRTANTSYDSNSLRPSSTISPTGAHTDYAYNDAAMSATRTAYLAAADGGGVTEQSVRYLNGRGQLRQEQALATGGLWDIVDQVYDNMGQLSQQTRPYRSGDSPQWSTTTYDALGRTATVTGPDGSVSQTFYNEASRPSVASSSAGETTRMQDAWGRERWGRANASGRIVEVVEPDPNGSGSVATNGMVTTYAYDTLAKLTQVTQGSQTRSLKYDSLGRLIAQKTAEASATLNDAGTYVGSGSWSDVFTYDERSNLVTRTDARGVKTVFTYSNDPLNRLQSVSFDTSGFGDTANPIVAAATISYQYRTKSSPSDLKDITQPATITTAGVSTESYAYDTAGRLSSSTLTLTSRSSYPFVTDYIYDSLDRAKDVRYPAEYGNGSTRRLVHNDFDVAGRVSGLTFDGQTQASSISYNAASQTTAITVGTGTNSVSESYSYNAQTGMLDSQTATRNGTQLLNLSYDYAGANGKRTGQLVKISNNLDHNKDRGYQYDALGRVIRATGGQTVNWAQRYDYDRYGNRGNAYSFNLEEYIRNFYQNGLNRQPTSTELNSWLSTLQTAYAQGQSQYLASMQSLGQSIFNSTEYANRTRTDHWFVYDLYKTYLHREPDSGGWAFWESQVPLNGRSNIRLAFDLAPEFANRVGGTAPYSPPGGAPIVPADGLQQLTFDGGSNHINVTGWSYDAAGNQTRVQNSAGGWQRFQYDAANRPVKVKADDNVTVLTNTTYGSSSERLIAEEGGNRTYYVSEDGAVYAEFSESGASTTPLWSKGYIYLGDRLLSTVTPNGGGVTTQYNHPDRLGTRLVTNPAAGTSFEQVALPFGTALANESTGSTNRRFTTYDRSPTTGLDYAVNRAYDPLQGRFTQVDPDSMNATSLENPQTLNLYSYCANDPVNNTDPSGLGFFSFLKKLFKWVVAALAVIAAVLTIIYNPVLFFTTFKAALGIIASITNAASQVLNALGVKTASAIFGIISAGASFGLSMAALWAPLEEKGGMIAKNIFKAIQDGATLASRTMTALGHNMVGQILDLASTVAGFISSGYKQNLDKDGKPIKGKFHFDPSAWAIYKVARATAEKVAVFSGNKALGDYLNIAGLAEDAYTLYRGIFHFNHEPKEGEKGGNIYGEAFKRVDGHRLSIGSNNAISIALMRLVRRQDRVVRLGNLARRVNTAFGRIDKIVALSH